MASTQATISRDIKQLHLVKEPTGHGTYKYAVSSSRARLNIADKLRTIFHESITSVDCAQNIVVFKTLAGLAPARPWITWMSTAWWARWQGRTRSSWS